MKYPVDVELFEEGEDAGVDEVYVLASLGVVVCIKLISRRCWRTSSRFPCSCKAESKY